MRTLSRAPSTRSTRSRETSRASRDLDQNTWPEHSAALRENLRLLIEESGGVHAFARKIGAQPGQVSAWRKAKRKPRGLSLRTFDLIAEQFRVSRDWLLTGNGPRHPEQHRSANQLHEDVAAHVLRETMLALQAENEYLKSDMWEVSGNKVLEDGVEHALADARHFLAISNAAIIATDAAKRILELGSALEAFAGAPRSDLARHRRFAKRLPEALLRVLSDKGGPIRLNVGYFSPTAKLLAKSSTD